MLVRRLLVALPHPLRAQLGQLAHRALVLGARVAVAEVAAQIEPQPVGQPLGLGDRLGILGEARLHRLRRGEHVAEVPAPLRLGRIERGVQADGDERVLHRRPRAGVGVDVTGGHAWHPQPPRQPHQPPVARPVIAQQRSLELDPEPLGPNASSSRRSVGSSWTPCSAQPLRQTSPSACSSTVSSDVSTVRWAARPADRRACARARA